MASGQGDRTVADVMQAGIPPVHRQDGLVESFAKMQDDRLGSLPVIDAGLLVGLLPRERVRAWLDALTSTKNPYAAQT
jgi:CBS domain-containing protein